MRRGDATRKRNYTAGVRLSPEEVETLGRAAFAEGKSLTAYLRDCALRSAEYQELIDRAREEA